MISGYLRNFTHKKCVWMFILIITITIFCEFCGVSKTYCAKSIVDMFPNSNGHRAVLNFNGNDYAILQDYSGYYIWDIAKMEPEGEAKPQVFYRLFGEKWYLYTYDDSEKNFLVVCLNDKNDGNYVTYKYYKDDIELPDVNSDMVKSIEFVRSEEELFRPDWSMNGCNSDVSITDSKIIEELLNSLGSDTEKKISKEVFDELLGNDSDYYMIVTFKNAPEKLCYLLGGLKVMDGSVVAFYNQTPESIDEWFQSQ